MKIVMLNENEYILLVDNTPAYGNAEKTVKTLASLGVDFREIEYGMCTMVGRGHNVAHYGVNKTFLFSECVGVDTLNRGETSHIKPDSSYKDAINQFKYAFVTQAIDETEGNKSEAMRIFGIPRKSMYNTLKKIH